jgi:RNA polymerase sigma-70 factor
MAADLLARLCREAREEWPELAFIPLAELEAFILARVPIDRLNADVRAADLLLAYACARGVLAAQDALHELTEEEIERVHLRIRPPVSVQHAQRHVYGRLFTVVEGGVARIALYRGDIDIVGYVRNVASRELLALASSAARRPESVEDHILQVQPATPVDPHLERVKQNYRAGLRLAITDSLTGLEPRERALLGYAVIEQVGVDALALMYAVHPVTMGAKLQSARERFEFRIKHRLAERLRIPQRDHLALVGFVKVQLDRLFAPLFPRDEYPTLIDEIERAPDEGDDP